MTICYERLSYLSGKLVCQIKQKICKRKMWKLLIWEIISFRTVSIGQLVKHVSLVSCFPCWDMLLRCSGKDFGRTMVDFSRTMHNKSMECFFERDFVETSQIQFQFCNYVQVQIIVYKPAGSRSQEPLVQGIHFKALISYWVLKLFLLPFCHSLESVLTLCFKPHFFYKWLHVIHKIELGLCPLEFQLVQMDKTNHTCLQLVGLNVMNVLEVQLYVAG